MAGNKEEGCAISISHIVDAILVPVVCSVEDLATFATKNLPSPYSYTPHSFHRGEPNSVHWHKPQGPAPQMTLEAFATEVTNNHCSCRSLERKGCCVASITLFCHSRTRAGPQNTVPMLDPRATPAPRAPLFQIQLCDCSLGAGTLDHGPLAAMHLPMSQAPELWLL